MVAAILHANNIRDMEADRARQQAHIGGHIWHPLRPRANSSFLFWALMCFSCCSSSPGSCRWRRCSQQLPLPEALRLIRIFNTSSAIPLLHQAQGRTAKLHGQFGLLMVLGLALPNMLG